MSSTPSVKTYSEAEAVARLAANLPTWRYADGSIERTYRTGGWRATLMIVNTIGHLAEVAWHHPDLSVSYASIVVKLSTHDAGGITDKDFALAGKIEAVVLWHPQSEGNGLDGIPSGDANAYVLSDGKDRS